MARVIPKLSAAALKANTTYAHTCSSNCRCCSLASVSALFFSCFAHLYMSVVLHKASNRAYRSKDEVCQVSDKDFFLFAVW